MPETNGRRWTDSSKVIYGLFGVIGAGVALIVTIGITVGSMLYGGLSTRVDENKVDIKDNRDDLTEQRVQNAKIIERLDQIKQKIDNQ